jgi:glyoxylase-like metal-dependent hydrolase (beta-lactamase superfamily II)
LILAKLKILVYIKSERNRLTLYSLLIILGTLIAFTSLSNLDAIYASHLEINITKLTDNIYVIQGSTVNVIVSIGNDGVILVDDQYAPVTEKIKSVIANLTGKPIKFVINTHWHPDHTGGNENLGEAGAIIISHENVRKRLSSDQFFEFINMTIPALSEKGLPIITFSESMTFYQNDEEIKITHLDNGHTDGDSAVYFRKNNVIHVSDDFSDRSYPLMDLSSGGSIDGLISSLKKILLMINKDTKVVAGHSEISNQTKVKDYLYMLIDVRDNINNMIKEGKSLDEIIQTKPTSKYDTIYYDHSFIKPKDLVTNIYMSLSISNQ